jgi:hypothetical protein
MNKASHYPQFLKVFGSLSKGKPKISKKMQYLN